MPDGNLLNVMTVSVALGYDPGAWTSLHPRPNRDCLSRATLASLLGLILTRRQETISRRAAS
jgi:hypothetical protein